jgi:hypothetical protein
MRSTQAYMFSSSTRQEITRELGKQNSPEAAADGEVPTSLSSIMIYTFLHVISASDDHGLVQTDEVDQGNSRKEICFHHACGNYFASQNNGVEGDESYRYSTASITVTLEAEYFQSNKKEVKVCPLPLYPAWT